MMQIKKIKLASGGQIKKLVGEWKGEKESGKGRKSGDCLKKREGK